MDGIDLPKHELVLVLGTLPINIYKKLYISYTHKQITLHVKSNYSRIPLFCTESMIPDNMYVQTIYHYTKNNYTQRSQESSRAFF